MRMSEIKGIGQYGEDVSVSDWRQIPGQTSGLGQYGQDVSVNDWKQIPGQTSGIGSFTDIVSQFSTGEKDLVKQIARAKKSGNRDLAQQLLQNAGGSFIGKFRSLMQFKKMKKLGGLGQSDVEGTWASSLGDGLGQYSTPDDAVDGLATMDEDQALYGVHGLGQAFQWQQKAYQKAALNKRKMAVKKSQKGGLMQAIISTNKDMRTSVARANAMKMAAAQKNPLVAAKIVENYKTKTIPGTNVQKAIIGAFGDAAKQAKMAQAAKLKAAAAAKGGDKQKAAAATVKFWQHSQKAATTAMKAEKTRLATAADKLAKSFDAQAQTLEMAAKKQIAKTGPSALTDRLMAQAQNAKSNAAKMKTQAAVVAATPDKVPGIPSNQRIADLANKFNIRTSRREQYDQHKAMIAVLSDLSQSSLAQADDYDGALSYYGADEAGKMMADIEFGNVHGVLAGLDGFDGMNGLLDDIVGGFKKVKDTVSSGFAAAKKGFNTVKDTVKKVLPGSKPPKAAEPPKALPSAASSASSAESFAMQSTAPVAPGLIFGMPKMYVIGGGVAVAAVAGYFLFMRPKA